MCVQLAPPHSYAPTAKAFIASPAETGRRSQQLSSTPVSSSSCLAAGPGRRLPDYTLRYRDTIFSHDTSPTTNRKHKTINNVSTTVNEREMYTYKALFMCVDDNLK